MSSCYLGNTLFPNGKIGSKWISPESKAACAIRSTDRKWEEGHKELLNGNYLTFGASEAKVHRCQSFMQMYPDFNHIQFAKDAGISEEGFEFLFSGRGGR